MREPSQADNIYPIGAHIRAKVAPGVALVIASYNQRIYYCANEKEPKGKHLAYYEHELIPPVN